MITVLDAWKDGEGIHVVIERPAVMTIAGSVKPQETLVYPSGMSLANIREDLELTAAPIQDRPGATRVNGLIGQTYGV